MKTLTHQPNFIDTSDQIIGITISSVEEPNNQCCICLNNCITKYECIQCKKRVKDNDSHSAKMCPNCGISHLKSQYGSKCPVCKTDGNWCRDTINNKIIVNEKKTPPNTDIENQNYHNEHVISINQAKMMKMFRLIADAIYIVLLSFTLGLFVRLIKGECVFTCNNIFIDLLHSTIVGLIILGIIYILALCIGTIGLCLLTLCIPDN